MSDIDDVELNINLVHDYKSGDRLNLQLSQFPEAKQAINSLIQRAKIEQKLQSDIKYHTLKAKYERIFLGGEEQALITKDYVKQLKHRLATLRKGLE